MLYKLMMPLVGILLISGCQGSSSGTSPVSAFEKRQIQQTILAYPVDVIYGSVLAILVDQGYTVQNSDKAGGLIVAEKFGEKRKWGASFERDVFSTSVIVSKSSGGANTSVRFTVRRTVYLNLGGTESIKDVEELVDSSISRSFFSLLKTEAERRTAGFN